MACFPGPGGVLQGLLKGRLMARPFPARSSSFMSTTCTWGRALQLKRSFRVNSPHRPVWALAWSPPMGWPSPSPAGPRLWTQRYFGHVPGVVTGVVL